MEKLKNKNRTEKLMKCDGEVIHQKEGNKIKMKNE